MEYKSREQCKIRKRGNSSSSSSSLVQKYRFKRAIVVGKRGGSTTPVPTWKTTIKSPTLSSLQNTTQSSQTQTGQKPQEPSVSARKLAATLWEINNIPSPLLRKDNSAQEPIKNREKLPKFSHLSDPSYYNPILEKMDRGRVNGHNKGRKRGTAFTKKHQLSDYNGSLMEIKTHAKGNGHRESVIGMSSRLKDVSNGLKASKELLKVLNRIWGLDEEEHSSRMSLVSALGLELDRARTQVDQLMKDQRSSRNEREYLTKHFEEEKAAWKSKERERIRNAIACISEELEVEKKLRRQTERLNKKLGKELAENKASLSRAEKELDSEKRAKEIIEQVCDELARGIGEDRAAVEELKRESAKVREEVEKEREMLQLADVLREERVQMKLSEAKYHFEEKNAAVEKLKDELVAYIKEKVTLTKENGDDGSPNYQNLQQLEVYLDKIRNNSSRRVDERVENEFILENGHADDEDGDDSGDSDLHSIELNMDNNSKSYKWSFAGEGDDLKRVSIDRDFKGRKSISENIQWGNICLQKRNPNGIDGPDWDLITKTQEKSDAFEDEIIRYKSVKSLGDHILSGCSIPNFASPMRQWGQSLPGTAASDASLVKA